MAASYHSRFMRKVRVVLGVLVLAVLAALTWRHASSDAVEFAKRNERPAAPAALSSVPASETLDAHAEAEARAEVAPPRSDAKSKKEEEDEEGFLRGRVVDSNASPIGGADVQVLRAEGRAFEYLGDHEFATKVTKVAAVRSGADGTFAVRLARGRAFDLRVRSDPFAVKQVYGVQAGDTVDVTMRVGASVEGVVRHARDGTPIEGVRMVFESEDGFESMWEGTTDANGHYLAQGLAPGRAHLLVIPEEDQPPFVKLELHEGERIVRDFDLKRGGTIEGEVRDKATGLPIAGAEVSWWSFLHKIAKTDVAGHYTLSGFRDRGNEDVQARAEGYGQTEARVVVSEGAITKLDLELPRARIVRGRVVTRAGEPAEAVYLAAIAHGSDRGVVRNDCRSTRTAADGRFEIRNLRPDLLHALFVRKDGFATTTFDLGAREKDASEIDVGDIVLARMSTLSGRILDASGAGLADVGIQLRAPRQGATVDTETLTMVSASTDDEGRFRFVDLHAGTQRLRVYKEGFPVIEAIDVELAEGESRRGFVITLGGDLTITGRVLDPDGAGVGNARVFFSAPNPAPRSFPSSVSRKDGSFVIAGLEAGEYTLTAEPPDDRKELVAGRLGPVQAGSSDVVLELPRAAFVTGRRASGERTWIVAFDANAARIDQTVTDEKGAFRIRVADGATVELRAWPAKRDLQYFGGYSADETTKPIAVLPGIHAGATDVVVE
jgi:protocatechuate 3,4-dioxygenase beta subunit